MSSATSSRSRDPAVARASRWTLIQEMKRQGIKIIIVEPYFDLKTPNAIARDTGAKVLVMPPSVGGVKEAADYIQLFDYNVNLLASAHQRRRPAR